MEFRFFPLTTRVVTFQSPYPALRKVPFSFPWESNLQEVRRDLVTRPRGLWWRIIVIKRMVYIISGSFRLLMVNEFQIHWSRREFWFLTLHVDTFSMGLMSVHRLHPSPPVLGSDDDGCPSPWKVIKWVWVYTYLPPVLFSGLEKTNYHSYTLYRRERVSGVPKSRGTRSWGFRFTIVRDSGDWRDWSRRGVEGTQ